MAVRSSYPGADEALRANLVMQRMVGVSNSSAPAPTSRVVDELVERTKEMELDYRLGRNQRAFARR